MRAATPIVLAAIIGAVIGIGASHFDANSQPDSVERALMVPLNMGSMWASAAMVAGWRAHRAGLAALAGIVTLISGVVAYYAYGLVAGDRAGLGLAAVSDVAQIWLVVGLPFGFVLGFIGWAARGRGWVGLLASLVAPIGIAGEVVLLLRPTLGEAQTDPARFWAIIIVVTAAAGVALAAAVGRLAHAAGPEAARPRMPASAAPEWDRAHVSEARDA